MPFAPLKTLCLLICTGYLLTAHAQSSPPPEPLYATTSLYEAFGKQDGIRKLTDEFVQRISTDPRVASTFKDSNLKRVREKIAEQLCQVTGGPCVYSGDSMKEVHRGLGIKMADFNVVVEILQDVMDQQNIRFQDQNKLLALLAPMHRDMLQEPVAPAAR